MAGLLIVLIYFLLIPLTLYLLTKQLDKHLEDERRKWDEQRKLLKVYLDLYNSTRKKLTPQQIPLKNDSNTP